MRIDDLHIYLQELIFGIAVIYLFMPYFTLHSHLSILHQKLRHSHRVALLVFPPVVDRSGIECQVSQRCVQFIHAIAVRARPAPNHCPS